MQKSKYNNKKVVVDGITFDSKKEANRYVELKLLERSGAIKNLQRQVRYILVPAQREIIIDGYKRKEGRVIEREVAYKADFVYIDTATGKKVVEDTKGFRTSEYVIKRKLMRHVHGIEIKEV
jgi:hypothetical protein